MLQCSTMNALRHSFQNCINQYWSRREVYVVTDSLIVVQSLTLPSVPFTLQPLPDFSTDVVVQTMPWAWLFVTTKVFANVKCHHLCI